MRNRKRNILNEKKRVNANLMERSKHYSDLLSERLLKQEKEKKGVKKVEIYDKAFFLNEEMNDLKGQLAKMNENMSNSEE